MRRLLVLALCTGIVSGGTRAAFAVLYPAMSADMGWSVGDVTGAYSVGMLVYSAAAIGSGWLADRVGVRVTMTAGALLEVAGSLVAAMAPSLGWVYLAWGVCTGIGLSGTGFISLLRALVRRPERLGLGFAAQQLGQGLGALAAAPGLRLAIDMGGWRVAHETLALAQLCLIPVVLLCAGGHSDAHPARASTAHVQRPLASLTAAVFCLLFAANFAFGLTQVVQVHQIAQLDRAGFSFADAATLAGLGGAIATVGAMAAGSVADRRLAWTLGAGGVAYATGALALAAIEPGAVGGIGLYIAGAGAGKGILALSLSVAEGRVLAGHRVGLISGLLEIGIGLGGFAGPWLAALGVDALGSFGPGLVGAAVAALATMLACGTALRLARPPLPVRVLSPAGA